MFYIFASLQKSQAGEPTDKSICNCSIFPFWFLGHDFGFDCIDQFLAKLTSYYISFSSNRKS